MDQQISNNIDNQNSSNKPQWLKELEAQSWQAELIASGLAIYGSIAMGDYLNSFLETLLPLFSDSILNKLKYVFIYLFMVQVFLVLSFIGHLTLRILWAGFLGLSSVFPDGIKISENSGYTLSFLQKVQKEFGDLATYSLKLDDYCSIIFSILCSMVLAILNIALWVLISIILSELINHFILPGLGDIIMYIFIVLLFLCTILVYLITNGSFKTSEFAEKYAYKISKSLSKAMYFLAYRPVNYVTWVSRTNMSGKQFVFASFAFILTTSLIAGFWYGEHINSLDSRSYYYMNYLPSRTNHLNYLDQIDDNEDRLLRPAIQSREISDKYIKLFIPKYKRDASFKIELCGEWEAPKDKDLERFEKRKLEEQFDVDCAQKYFQIAIDGAVYPDLEFSYIRRMHKGGRGYLTYIPLDNIPAGQHLLTIQTGYVYDNKKECIRQIPFYLNK